jgi:hypothetical protein
LIGLPSEEIERILVSRFKENAISDIEIQELIAILGKEKHIVVKEEEEEGKGMLIPPLTK